MKKIKLLQSGELFWDLKDEELGYISEKMVARKESAILCNKNEDDPGATPSNTQVNI